MRLWQTLNRFEYIFDVFRRIRQLFVNIGHIKNYQGCQNNLKCMKPNNILKFAL
jgi:hypothetical protein